MRLFNARPAGALFVLIILSGIAVPATGASSASPIAWQSWSREPFEQARKLGRMVLVDVGIEGCTACRWMDEDTYHDAEVVRLVREHFVPIQVDAESRPDIGERYSDWAWPATIFLAPDGTQVLALRGNRRPANFVPILKKLIADQAAGRLSADSAAPYGAPPEPTPTPLSRLRDVLRQQLDRDRDPQRGGYGIGAIHAGNAAPLRQLLLRAQLTADPAARESAIKGIDRLIGIIDPVWGGLFVAGVDGDRRIIPEKRISGQASGLLLFATAWQLTGDRKYLDAAAGVHRYIRDWMTAPDGTFYTSQEDAAPNLPPGMDARGYYALDSDAERRRYGVPPVDHAVHTDKNGEVILAYTRLYETTGDPSWLTVARRAANRLLATRWQADGWLLQSLPNGVEQRDDRMRSLVAAPRIYLQTQARFGLALLALYEATGEQRWLLYARGLAKTLLARLQDPANGGFWATEHLAEDPLPPRKPLEANAMAARLLYLLSVNDKAPRLERAARRAIAGTATPAIVRREGRITGELALALETLTAGYVEFSVVGEPGSAASGQLLAASRRVYQPRRVLHVEPPGRYPDLGHPALYICNPDACSLPITDPGRVATEAARFQGPATSLQPPKG